jgi:hypothetical protein
VQAADFQQFQGVVSGVVGWWWPKRVKLVFELTTFKMTFRDRIVVRKIDVRALVRKSISRTSAKVDFAH